MNESGELSASDLHPPPAAAGMRIGLLGGSFNPPHAAHKLISDTALKRLKLAQVWWLVTPGNPLKDRTELAPLAGARCVSCRALAANSHIKITAFEKSLNSSYTSSTLRFLRQRFPRTHFVWLMGADNLASFHRWHDWEEHFRAYADSGG